MKLHRSSATSFRKHKKEMANCLPNFDIWGGFVEGTELEEIDPSIFDEELFEDVKMEPEQPKKRFKSLTAEELQDLSKDCHAKSTRQNSQWGANILKDWCHEKGMQVDLMTISEADLAELLPRFYAEVQPRTATKGAESSEYQKNTIKNMRAAINRHLQVDCSRNINIVTGPNFKKANEMLNAKLKRNCREGLSRPTSHKPVIPKEDMAAIFHYLNQESPITLRYKVWIQLSLQYVSRGLEFHGQLTPNSFKFCTDETGSEYVTLVHATQQKNHQGGINCNEESYDKRMYADGDKNCPVDTLRRFLGKLSQNSQHLFCHVNKEAIQKPNEHTIWYGLQPVRQRQFSNFMSDICKNAGLNKRYTAHCLRATALNAMTDKNVPPRHIMTLSDHSSEMSLVPYTRPSTSHKKDMSKVLSNIYNENNLERANVNEPITQTHGQVHHEKLNMSSMLSSYMTSSNCSFSNCSFSFGSK